MFEAVSNKSEARVDYHLTETVNCFSKNKLMVIISSKCFWITNHKQFLPIVSLTTSGIYSGLIDIWHIPVA